MGYSLLVDSEFFQRLKQDIMDAGKSIDLQFMTFEADSAGIGLAGLLMKKADSGVRVRLIIDRFNDYMVNDCLIYRPGKHHDEHARTARLFNEMERAGIHIARTGRHRQHALKSIFCPNHKKIVAIDQKIAYVGGFNISEHNFSWHDFMVRVTGRVAGLLQSDFEKTFRGETGSYTKKHGFEMLVSDHPAGGASVIYDRVLDLISAARESVFIETPYLSGRSLIAAIARKADQKVKITIILPLQNNRIFYRGVACHHRQVFSNKADLRHYTACNGMTHAKLLVVDGRTAVFGSSNLSRTSSLLDDEISIFSQDRQLLAQINERIVARDIRDSVPQKPEIYDGLVGNAAAGAVDAFGHIGSMLLRKDSLAYQK